MPLTRREVIKAGLAGSVALLLPRGARAQQPPAPTKPLVVAHLTDLHIQPERRAREGVVACLQHVRQNAPDLILTGGDLVFDTFEQTDARAKLLWDMFNKVWRDECAIPTAHCLGNHDHWGWNKGKSKTTGAEPNWGIKRALEALSLPRPYHAFEQAGWKFIILDSTHPDPRDANGYIGRLDDAQHEWLTGELAAAKTMPTLILSHIPILSATNMLPGKEPVNLDRKLSNGLMHADAKRLVALFAQHPQVKLCLSGHVHEIDRIEYQGVTYLCNGAVSGNWWKGRHKMCDEGYARLELFPDGAFTSRYVTYGWKAEA